MSKFGELIETCWFQVSQFVMDFMGLKIWDVMCVANPANLATEPSRYWRDMGRCLTKYMMINREIGSCFPQLSDTRPFLFCEIDGNHMES